ncbi:hypothetical protein [Cupriavidus taiwanensis]|uniref:Uncharacterized protein n=1 Tax=Cupriavidus taiwanensis TaxID=164546 RepID=A0A375JCS9_9BURK|nr:hypothetical protein [Cupriavidus taiwanensis]SPS02602.1 hypothetical protein CBM2634_U20007 [Cupriavidus taiwanensis]
MIGEVRNGAAAEAGRYIRQFNDAGNNLRSPLCLQAPPRELGSCNRIPARGDPRLIEEVRPCCRHDRGHLVVAAKLMRKSTALECERDRIWIAKDAFQLADEDCALKARLGFIVGVADLGTRFLGRNRSYFYADGMAFEHGVALEMGTPPRAFPGG